MKSYEEMSESVLKRRDEYMVKRRKRMKKMITMISCLCMFLGAGVWKSQKMTDNESVANEHGGSNVVTEDSSGTEQKNSELLTVLSENFNESKEASATENINPTVTPEFNDSDEPIALEGGSTGSLNMYEEIYGGSYMNENGNWVVWLTEDTPENRAKVFDKNPSISKNNTEFKNADYSFAYLTQLMDDISKAMSSGKLPFVCSASLQEQKNRVEVMVTEAGKDVVGKVLAIDSLGGAIEIEYGVQMNVNELDKEKQ